MYKLYRTPDDRMYSANWCPLKMARKCQWPASLAAANSNVPPFQMISIIALETGEIILKLLQAK